MTRKVLRAPKSLEKLQWIQESRFLCPRTLVSGLAVAPRAVGSVEWVFVADFVP